MIAAPTFDKLMWPAVLALKSLDGSATNEELLAKLTELLKLPQEVQAVSHSDGRQTKVSYNLAWAKSYMKKVGLLDNSARGVWTLTPDGEACTETSIVNDDIWKSAHHQKPYRLRCKLGSHSADPGVISDPGCVGNDGVS